MNEPSLSHKTDVATTRLSANDHLHSVSLHLTVATTAESHEDIGHASKVRMTVDYAALETFANRLLDMVDARKARIAALPTYTVRFIDDPAFPTQRMAVVKLSVVPGRADETLFIGTEVEVRENYDVFKEQPGWDNDGRRKYWARDKT